MTEQEALEAAAAYFALTVDQARTLVIMLGEAYDTRISTLYRSAYGAVHYGFNDEIVDWDRYSKSHHRKFGPARNKTAGARFVWAGHRVELEFRSVRGKAHRAWLPTSRESLVYNPFKSAWVSVEQIATVGSTACGVKVEHLTREPRAWWLDGIDETTFDRYSVTGLRNGVARAMRAQAEVA